MRPGTILALAFVALVSFGLATAGETTAPPHKLTGTYVEFCSCDRFCETAVADEGRRGVCAFVAALKIEAGQRGEISLGGLTAAVVSPGPSPEGKATQAAPVIYVDRTATPPQQEAIRAILSDKFAGRMGATLGPPKPALIVVTRTSEAVSLSIESVADLRAQVFTGAFGRGVQIENVPATALGYPFLGRGSAGQIVDSGANVTFDAKGKNVFYGKFDFGSVKKGGKKTRG